MRPRIAIPVPNSDAEYSARALPQYVGAIEQAGGEAVVIALDKTNSEVAQLLKQCDGVLLPGSPADIDPQKYGESERHAQTSPSDPARDNVDELLLQDAHNMRKPLLGICYGTQSLNVWRTGTLVQHLETDVNHAAGKQVPIAHEVEVAPGSRLASILGLNKGFTPEHISVNSSHHQAVQTPGDGLRAVAKSPSDGVVEALESTDPNHLVIGVQWHPERSAENDAYSQRLFQALVSAAREWHIHMLHSRRQDFETLNR